MDASPEKITPIIHFVAENRIVVDDGQEIEVQAVQLVRAGEVLVTFPGQNIDQHGDAIEYQVISGKNTELSLDESTLSATLNGYPAIIEKRVGQKKILTIFVTPFITVNSDKMYAHMSLQPNVTGNSPITIEFLEHILKEIGIISGIDKQTLKESVERLQSSGIPQKNILVARGILPMPGKDARFRFEIEVGPIAGKLLRNGQIDFRERKVFVSIEENEQIAVLVPPTDGTPGKNIFGEQIAQKPGKNIKVVVSGDAHFNPETGKVRATSSGILSIVNENNIKVSSKLVISGNVDYSIGNIESKDSIEISGTVMPGFSVATLGDVVIGGNVQSASVISKANAIIKGGLVGNRSSVKTHGDVDIKFIENGKIQAGGNIIIRQASYYSNIIADGSIHCNENSRIIGGTLICAKDFSCGDIGSYSSDPATIATGVSKARFILLQNYNKRASELMKLVAKHKKLHGENVPEKPKIAAMKLELQEVLTKLSELNLLPGNPEYSRKEPFMNYSDVEIHVHGTITAGTNVRIGNIVQTIEKDYINSKLVIDSIEQKILIKPL